MRGHSLQSRARMSDAMHGHCPSNQSVVPEKPHDAQGCLRPCGVGNSWRAVDMSPVRAPSCLPPSRTLRQWQPKSQRRCEVGNQLPLLVASARSRRRLKRGTSSGKSTTNPKTASCVGVGMHKGGTFKQRFNRHVTAGESNSRSKSDLIGNPLTKSPERKYRGSPISGTQKHW